MYVAAWREIFRCRRHLRNTELKAHLGGRVTFSRCPAFRILARRGNEWGCSSPLKQELPQEGETQKEQGYGDSGKRRPPGKCRMLLARCEALEGPQRRAERNEG
jgi:hypothetical protein